MESNLTIFLGWSWTVVNPFTSPPPPQTMKSWTFSAVKLKTNNSISSWVIIWSSFELVWGQVLFSRGWCQLHSHSSSGCQKELRPGGCRPSITSQPPSSLIWSPWQLGKGGRPCDPESLWQQKEGGFHGSKGKKIPGQEKEQPNLARLPGPSPVWYWGGGVEIILLVCRIFEKGSVCVSGAHRSVRVIYRGSQIWVFLSQSLPHLEHNAE